MGGIGNQLFIYAFGRSLQQASGAPVHLDTWHHSIRSDRPFAIGPVVRNLTFSELPSRLPSPVAHSRLFRRLRASRLSRILSPRLRQEFGPGFDPSLLELVAGQRVRGYFQSWRYFQPIGSQILDEMQTDRASILGRSNVSGPPPDDGIVAVHIRRGDYMTRRVRNRYPLTSAEYYSQALGAISQSIQIRGVRVFSDSPAEAAALIRNCTPLPIFLSESTPRDDLIDLLYFSMHSAVITANSTFSWWGAWLSGLPGEAIVTPRRWLNDTSFSLSSLVPTTWTSL